MVVRFVNNLNKLLLFYGLISISHHLGHTRVRGSFGLCNPLAAPVMRPYSLPRLWRYINLLLTYLLTPTPLITGASERQAKRWHLSPVSERTIVTWLWSDPPDRWPLTS